MNLKTLCAGFLFLVSAHVPERPPAPEPLSRERVVHASTVRNMLVANGAPPRRAAALAPLVLRVARQEQVAPELLVGLLMVENPDLLRQARNASGATGLMQVMPGWPRALRFTCGRDLTDPETNLCYGVQVFKIHLADAGGNIRRALLAYNGCVRAVGCEAYAGQVLQRIGVARVTP